MGTKDGGKSRTRMISIHLGIFLLYDHNSGHDLVPLNRLVFPSTLKSQVKEVGYNEFLAMVDNKPGHTVEKDDRTASMCLSRKTAMERAGLQDRTLG